MVTEQRRKLRSLTCLAGNGLSIAFNPDLSLQSVTNEVVARLDADAPVRPVSGILIELARINDAGDAEVDFEALVGTLSSQHGAFVQMAQLCNAMEPTDQELATALRRSATFAAQLADVGVSQVLDVIGERSIAYYERQEPLSNWLKSLVTEFADRLTFANLNYDTMLHAGLLEWPADLCDMGDGRQRQIFEDAEGLRLPCNGIRTEDDFPDDRRIRLIHMHGSYTWWRQGDDRQVYRIDADQVRSSALLSRVRNQTTSLRPVVVLANRIEKPTVVERYPFDLSYDIFSSSLQESDHWLVVGYSFRDSSVNERLRRAALARERGDMPKVCVITYGDEPSKHLIEQEFGWSVADGPSSWLTVIRTGVLNSPETSEWQSWII